MEIVGVELTGREGSPARVFASGDPVDIHMRVRANTPMRDCVFGVGLFNSDGVCCYGTNTHIEGAATGEVTGEGEARFSIERLDLVAGTYKLDVAVHRENGVPYDYHRLLYTFRVTSPLREVGVFRPPHRWSFSGDIHMPLAEPAIDRSVEG